MNKYNKKIKEEIKNAFDFPASQHKLEFMASLKYNNKSNKTNNKLRFYITQILYINKTSWLISLLFFTITLFVLRKTDYENIYSSIWIVSSFVPFLSFSLIYEIIRNSVYKMDELEMSCRYNCSDIILVRSSLLGIFNLVILLISALVLSNHLDYSLYKLGLYISTPFILTNISSLIAAAYIKGSLSIYTCLCIACIIGTANYIFSTECYSCFDSQLFIIIWSILFILLIIFSITQFIFLLKNKETLIWNLK